jgi:hypothetical protein
LITTIKERPHEEKEKIIIATSKCPIAKQYRKKIGENCGVEGVEGGA